MPKIYNLTDTWNNGATAFDAIKIDVTDTASAAESKLLDLQVGGVSRFEVDKQGNITNAGTISGLENVDNTSDLDKPVSTLTQAAIDALVGNSGTATYDPPSLADGSGVTTTVTVTGAALGDFAAAAFTEDTQGVTVSAWVSAADTVSVRFQNETGGVVDLASGTIKARAN